jgi:predicted HicB family RNase H-like nuclease
VFKIKQMTVRIEDGFYKDVKIALIEKEKSFNEYVIELIKQDLEKQK